MTFSLKTEHYYQQSDTIWPSSGKHILAQYDDDDIIVYQAFRPEIADYAVKHGKFGGSNYNFTRMTWIKTNFMWMMFRSGWAQKKLQERILAISITRRGFEEILAAARGVRIQLPSSIPDDVRLQWDPDHDPYGGKLQRRAVQLGLKGEILAKFHKEYITKITDITDFVLDQYEYVKDKTLGLLISPSERVFIPSDPQISQHIRLAGFEREEDTETDDVADSGAEGKTDFARMLESMKSERAKSEGVKSEGPKSEGACCSNLLPRGLEDRKQTERLILCLGGAFNPVHQCHVQAMEEAVKWISRNTPYDVVRAGLAVAPDGYVKGKCRKNKANCMKGEHRIKLCNIMCQNSDIVKPFHHTTGSALQCAREMKRELGLPSAKIAIVVGADRAVNKAGKTKWEKRGDHLTVCIGRNGTGMEELKSAFNEDLKLGLVDSSQFYFIEKELENLSSTDIRKELAKLDECESEKEKSDIIESIVKRGWFTEEMGSYILEHFEDLYM